MDFDIISSSLKKGWETFKGNAVAYIVGLIVMYIVCAIVGAIVVLLGGTALIAALASGSTAGVGMAFIGVLIGAVIMILVLCPLSFGLYYMAIKGLRGDKVEIGDIFYAFKSKDVFIRSLIYYVIYAILFGILGLIPILGWLIAFVVEFLLLFALLIYIMTPSENVFYAFKESFNVVKENIVLTLVAYIVVVLLVCIGVLLLGIGLLVTLPIAAIFMAAVLREFNPSLNGGSI